MLTAIVFIIILLFSAILHEVAHGVVAEKFGDTTARDMGRITLNPLPHIDPVFSILVPLLLYLSGSPVIFGFAKPVPVNYYRLSNKRWGVFCVSIAGIVTNLILAFAFSIPLHSPNLNATAQGICTLVVEMNIALAVINMIPIPPIDGSKAIAALLGEKVLDRVLALEYRGVWGMLPFIIIIYLLFLTPFFGTAISPIFNFFFRVFGIA